MQTTYDSALARALRARIRQIIDEKNAHLLMGRATSFDDYKGRCYEIKTLTSLLEIIDGIEEQLGNEGQANPVVVKGRSK